MEVDTIAAIATPPGTGAISLIRVSGPGAGQVVGRLLGLDFARVTERLPPRRAVLATLRDEGGAVLDQALVTRFTAPASFTGEEVIELACHGGVVVTRAVFQALLDAGARAAEGGEFTRRAFENGKLDLTQAEAVMDLISARSDLARRAAQGQLEGRLGRRIQLLRERLMAVVAHLEAWIDFPDEDIDPASVEQLVARLGQIEAMVAELLATGWQGRMLREGARVVLSGRPNAGKSSVLNALSGFERAIVSEMAGTTRDTVEEWLELGGVPVRLVDTAGLRADSDDAIESEGMRRTRAEWVRADLVIEIVDASQPGGPDAELVAARESYGFRHLLLLNKRDLGEDPAWDGVAGLRFSATGDEPETLATAIRDSLELGGRLVEGDLVAVNARHQAELGRVADSLAAAKAALLAGTEPDLVALDLREALAALGEIVGKVDVEEILGEIFATFCIGK